MDTKSKKRGESQLSFRQREVLLLRLAGLTNPEIASLLLISDGTVKTHVNKGLTNLGIEAEIPDGDREFILIREEVRTKLLAIEKWTDDTVIESAPPEGRVDPSQPVNPPVNLDVPENKPLEQTPTETTISKGGDIIVLNPHQRPRWPWLLAGIGLGIVWLLAIQLYAVEVNVRGGVSGLQQALAVGGLTPTPASVVTTQPVTVTQIIKETVQVPVTVEVTRLTEVPVTRDVEVQVTRIVEVPVTREVTATPIPVSASAADTTPVATSEGQAVGTPTPTEQATTLDYGMPLPFADDFTDGWRKEWIVVDGAPVVNEIGLRNSGSDLIMQLGNENLHDYTVEFTATERDFVLNFGANFRYREFLTYINMLGRDVCYYELLQDAQWTLKAQGGKCLLDRGRFRITLQGNTYTVYKNGQQISKTTFESVDQRGPFIITLIGGNTISDFRLTVP